MRKIIIWAALVVTGVGVVTSRAGSLVFDVTLNTQPLTAPGVDSGPFYLDFQLTGGNGNIVTIDSFDFGSGAAVGSPTIGAGDASGDIGSSVTLTSVGADNELWQQFSPGGTVSFRVTTTELLTSTNPDGFFFNILDNTLSNIPTQDPQPYNDFLSLTYSSPNGPVVSLFGNNPTIAPNGSNSGTPIGEIDAPTVNYPQVAPLPSAGLACLVLLIGCGIGTSLRNRHRE